MPAFQTQLRIDKPRHEVFGAALANFTQPLARSGFKLQEQDQHHIIWSRSWRWGLLWGLFSGRKRIIMSLDEADGGGTILTIAGDAPRGIAKQLEDLVL